MSDGKGKLKIKEMKRESSKKTFDKKTVKTRVSIADRSDKECEEFTD